MLRASAALWPSSLSRPLSVTRCLADTTARRRELSIGIREEEEEGAWPVDTPRDSAPPPPRRKAHMIGSRVFGKAWRGRDVARSHEGIVGKCKHPRAQALADKTLTGSECQAMNHFRSSYSLNMQTLRKQFEVFEALIYLLHHPAHFFFWPNNNWTHLLSVDFNIYCVENLSIPFMKHAWFSCKIVKNQSIPPLRKKLMLIKKFSNFNAKDLCALTHRWYLWFTLGLIKNKNINYNYGKLQEYWAERLSYELQGSVKKSIQAVCKIKHWLLLHFYLSDYML